MRNTLNKILNYFSPIISMFMETTIIMNIYNDTSKLCEDNYITFSKFYKKFLLKQKSFSQAEFKKIKMFEVSDE